MDYPLYFSFRLQRIVPVRAAPAASMALIQKAISLSSPVPGVVEGTHSKGLHLPGSGPILLHQFLHRITIEQGIS